MIRLKAFASASNSVKKVLLPLNGSISDVTLSGDSKLHINLSSDQVKMSLSGNSVVYASGACRELDSPPNEGLDFTTDAGWERLLATIDQLVDLWMESRLAPPPAQAALQNGGQPWRQG